MIVATFLSYNEGEEREGRMRWCSSSRTVLLQWQCFYSACQPITVLVQLFWLLIGCLKALSLEHIRRVCKGECVGYIRQMDYMTQHSQWSDLRLLTWLDHDCSNMISPCLFKHVLVQTWFHHACSNMILPCWHDFIIFVQTWFYHVSLDMISPCSFSYDITMLVQTWFHHACSNMISPCLFRQNFIILVQTWFHHVCPDMISSYLFMHDFTILVQS